MSPDARGRGRAGARARLVVALLFPIAPAAARPLHGNLGGGGAALATGADGDHLRGELALEIKPTRLGALVAWRAFDATHDGLITAGITFEGAAARPRLVLDLHAELGVDLDARAPLVGGGIRTALAIIGPVGVALDTGAFLVIDGVDDTRLQLQSSAIAIVRW